MQIGQLFRFLPSLFKLSKIAQLWRNKEKKRKFEVIIVLVATKLQSHSTATDREPTDSP